MKICPRCREEFLDHIELCRDCNTTLVSEHSFVELSNDVDVLSKEELASGETIALIEGGIAQCREVERILLKSQISCLVYPKNLTCDSHGSALGTSCDMKYLLLIREGDLDAARLALEGQFSAQVLKEGLGHYHSRAINLDDEIVNCPACGEANPLKDGECPVCGLFLGVVDPTN